MSEKCVWVREIAILHATKPEISHWEIWAAFNTKQEALKDLKESYRGRLKVSSAFKKATNKIVKYVPAEIK